MLDDSQQYYLPHRVHHYAARARTHCLRVTSIALHAEHSPKLAALLMYKCRHPELSWIIGDGWDQSMWGGAYPSRQDIDEACADRPVFLYRNCCHIGVANSAALRIAGLLPADTTSATSGSSTASEQCKCSKDVQGGVVDVDDSGIPTGIMRETAVELVTKHMGAQSHTEAKACYAAALQRCLQSGLTAVQVCKAFLT
jgi:predicted amidohydrolase YtcJ